MSIRINENKTALMFGDFIAAAYRAWGRRGRKNLCGWPSMDAWLCFAGPGAM